MKSEDFRNIYEYNPEKDKLGEGSFGTVYRVVQKDTKEKRAIKLIDINKFKKNYQQENFKLPSEEDIKRYTDYIMKEIESMKIMQGKNQENENSVKLYEYYHYKEEIAIVMELCDENLSTMIRNKNQIFTFCEIREILNQLNNSFKIMNEKNMAHRDLKPQNILVKYKDENNKNDFIIKLSDYGEAKELSMTKGVFTTKNVGTSNYMAPEILMGQPHNLECDLWSLGVIIYRLYFRQTPYPMAKSDFALINQINNYGQKHFLKSLNEDFDNLIRKLLKNNPKERITWEEYFKHSFLTQNQILMTVKMDKEDINKNILILNGIGEDNKKNEEIQNLKNSDYIIFINDKLEKSNKFFKHDKTGEYKIKIIFKKKLKDLSFMFYDCKNLIKINLSSLDTYKVTNMNNMFDNCTSLEEINLSDIYVNKVIDMSYLFNKCYKLKKIIHKDSFNTKNVKNISYMFSSCQNLEEVNFPSSFDTNSVTNMEHMFNNCNKLEKLDFEKFEINAKTNTENMFRGCDKLKNIPDKFKNIKFDSNEELSDGKVDNKKVYFDKEYYEDGKLKYEGEYLNGIKNGKGKEYYSNGKLQFEGEYLNGEKNGKCKEYYDNGKLKYEGEYLNGKMKK